MKTKKKAFDCVEMMHEAGLQIHEILKDMTREEQLAYWRERNEAARVNYPRIREAESVNTTAE